ncbi:MAG: hypothetical protein ACLSWI_04125 [Candidatus Gastranaerophilaceae bacterium]
MGMAASQARLLSITSRMSDNELRAQLINNSKMRLATESSQVSESYVAALNEAQMMYTNYGANDTTSYQNLTFNALTNYSQYNNQYGLTNSSGMLLVSEKDAKNYMNADGSLDKFLSSYGITRGTTYFDNLGQKYVDESGAVDGLGGYTAEELKAMYYGTNGYQGYQALLTSESYFKYQDYTEKLSTSYNGLLANSWDGIKDQVLKGAGYTVEGTGFSEFVQNTEKNNNSGMHEGDNGAYSSNYYPGKINSFMNYIDSVASDGKLASGTNNALYKEVKSILGEALAKYNLATVNQNISYDEDGNEIVTTEYLKQNGNYNTSSYGADGVKDVAGYSDVIKVADNQLYLIFDNARIEITKSGSSYIINGPIDNEPPEDGDPLPSDKLGVTCTQSGSTLTVNSVHTDEDDDGNVTVNAGIPEFTTNINLDELFNQTASYPVDAEKSYSVESKYTYYQAEIEADLQAEFEYAADLWENSLKYNINPSMFSGVSGTEEFMSLGQQMAQFIFGENAIEANGGPIKTSDYPSLMTIEGIQSILESYSGLGFTENFHNVLDLLTLENMMDLYGEPNVTYIDSTDTKGTGNAEKKAQWYTNLFERMGNGKKNNFKVLADGLASSADWIKYALESGLVSMEQVNKSNEWNSIMYGNCSDITEQNNDVAVTKAEAEYKKAMNKIESKDKQYDMELKNIDTEHNSLQTEYDSIKSVIDKNVERTFKIYS